MYRWHITPPVPAQQQRLADALHVHPITAQVLINRGIADPDIAQQFLRPQLSTLHDPFLLPDMDVAVMRVLQAVQQREPITVYGDYDVDGTCGTALLTRFLRMVGATVDTYIPHRERDGYGVHRHAIDVLRVRGTRLIITVDTGTTALEAIGYAREHGIDVIVTDHHEIDHDLPPALAVINPKRAGHHYPFRELCGTGVAFKLLTALRQRLRASGWFHQHPEPNLRALLDLVAVATIADIVPLTGENRTLASIGLQQLATSPQCGLDALMRVAGVDRSRLDGYAVGFQIGPRLNAAGRMADANLAVQLLLTEDRDEAVGIAAQLNTHNTERQRVEAEVRHAVDARLTADPLLLADRASIVLADDAWPAGVVGIVASRVAETYRLPTILIGLSGDIGKGSGRTVGDFPLLETIRAAGEHLEKFGGHAAAAGVTVQRARLADFVHAFDAAARTLLRAEHRERVLAVDADILPEDISLTLAEELAQLEPFGLGNPMPLFVVRDLAVQQRRIVGKNHLQMQFVNAGQIIRAIGFSMGDRPEAQALHLDLVFTPAPNTWNGSTNVQLKLRDMRTTVDTVRQRC